MGDKPKWIYMTISFVSTERKTLSCFWGSGLLACAGLFLSPFVMAADTGDAPASYGQASHAVVPGTPWLGNEEPDDNQPVADNAAQGDDLGGIDDEDGVFAFPVLVQNGKSYDTNVFATNPGLNPANLVGWVDFDGNGRFDADEFTSDVVPAGTVNGKFKLQWPELLGITTDFSGVTYARFRISYDVLSADDAQSPVSDGEVEDYALEVLLDTDGDERPDISDPDNDNDGIPDLVEGTTVDTDNDMTPDYLDFDSDADFIPDYIEAGANPSTPQDSDNDGTPDYLDSDSNNDGIPDSEPPVGDADRDGISDDLEGSGDSDADGILNTQDLDSDNDTIPDAIEFGDNPLMPLDSDADGIADFLDLDSDNDGIPDIREANSGELDVKDFDTDFDGQVDAEAITGANGLVDAAETGPDSGIPRFAVADSDQDGLRDFRDLDSDADGIFDISETLGMDVDSNGVVDSDQDLDSDGLVDGSNAIDSAGGLTDVDGNGVPDFQDDAVDGSQPTEPEPEPTPGTDPGSNPSVPPLSGRVETGLSGGAGCSIASYGTAQAAWRSEWSLAAMVVLSVFSLAWRRNRGT